MKVSVLFPESRDVRQVIELAQLSEEAGLHGMFLGAAFGFDTMMALSAAGPHTSRILLGTAVVPTWPRHPLVAAQQAATANSLCGGRFRLGMGPSHRPVMKMYGVDYDRPIRHVREYISIVKALLTEGKVDFDGELFRVKAFLDVEGGGHPPVLVAALHEQLCRTAGALADGVLPWLAPPSYVAEVVVPQVAKGAADAGRPAPPVIAEIPVILSTDVEEVRGIVRRELGMYLYMPFYTDVMARAGIPDAEGAARSGWTDAMIDALIPWGDEQAVEKTVQSYLDAGAQEVVLSPFGRDNATMVRVLGDVARA
ncbi:MAG TPA: TIGR03564 family F420-dependent LLM class oxidoreductase [Acidimicrobiales bacterium]|nr:TIGR03564 family F420-dependent LLM class oxidoreductase [Acidimicrobiales bacterium]